MLSFSLQAKNIYVFGFVSEEGIVNPSIDKLFRGIQDQTRKIQKSTPKGAGEVIIVKAKTHSMLRKKIEAMDLVNNDLHVIVVGKRQYPLIEISTIENFDQVTASLQCQSQNSELNKISLKLFFDKFQQQNKKGAKANLKKLSRYLFNATSFTQQVECQASTYHILVELGGGKFQISKMEEFIKRLKKDLMNQSSSSDYDKLLLMNKKQLEHFLRNSPYKSTINIYVVDKSYEHKNIGQLAKISQLNTEILKFVAVSCTKESEKINLTIDNVLESIRNGKWLVTDQKESIKNLEIYCKPQQYIYNLTSGEENSTFYENLIDQHGNNELKMQEIIKSRKGLKRIKSSSLDTLVKKLTTLKKRAPYAEIALYHTDYSYTNAYLDDDDLLELLDQYYYLSCTPKYEKSKQNMAAQLTAFVDREQYSKVTSQQVYCPKPRLANIEFRVNWDSLWLPGQPSVNRHQSPHFGVGSSFYFPIRKTLFFQFDFDHIRLTNDELSSYKQTELLFTFGCDKENKLCKRWLTYTPRYIFLSARYHNFQYDSEILGIRSYAVNSLSLLPGFMEVWEFSDSLKFYGKVAPEFAYSYYRHVISGRNGKRFGLGAYVNGKVQYKVNKNCAISLQATINLMNNSDDSVKSGKGRIEINTALGIIYQFEK